MIKPILTDYGDYRFRSRLEARWALFFDRVGIAWDYEPEGFSLPVNGRYLPDFWLPESACYVEIKPFKTPVQKETAKCKELSQEHRVLLICGDPLEHRAMTYENGDRSGPFARNAMSDWPMVKFSPGMRDISLVEFGSYTSTKNAARDARKAKFEHGETPKAKARFSRPAIAEEPKGFTEKEKALIDGMNALKAQGYTTLEAIKEMLKKPEKEAK